MMLLSVTSHVLPIVWWIILGAFIGASVAEKPSFRIIAPEFICNPQTGVENIRDNGSRTDIGPGNSSPAPRQLTIGFQTAGGQRLYYRVTTYFMVLGESGFISQRHTVGLWRTVRQFEQRVRRDRDVIAQNGQMTIAADELLPGVVYTFGVVAIDADGDESDEQNFTMTYRNVEQGASYEHGGTARSNSDVSLLMLGAEMSYADVEYIVTAQTIFCRRRTDYFFRWSIGGMNGSDPVAVAMERSELLRIPAGTFDAGRTYDVKVSVHTTSNEEEILAKAALKVLVLRRQPEVYLFPVDAIVGIDQPVRVRSYVRGTDVVWTCQKDGDDGKCDDTIDSSDGLMVTFYKEGTYRLTASVAEPSPERAASQTLLSINAKVTPSVQLLEWSRYPAVAGDPFELLVSVAGLVPNCYSNWTVVREEGFAYFDPALLPNGATLGGFIVRDMDENFLSELVDYGNDTMVKDVTLFIPAGPVGPWKGLQPDVRYKLRLETVCPEPIDDSKVAGGQRAHREMITSHWTFVLETNGAPQTTPIVVTPEANGTALGTVFKISTGIAKDTERDYPLKYSFWYVADGVDINIGTYYEITSAETVLPYARNGSIGTYALVCDSRDACSKVMGPNVSLQPGNGPTVDEVMFTFENIGQFFDRLNLRQALKTSFELLITLRNRNSSQYDTSYRRFAEMLQQSIAHIGKVRGETAYLTEGTIQEFVMQAKPILDLEESNNHELFQQLLELMDPAAEPTAQRPKRASSPASSVPFVDKIKTKLSLMESLTVSKNATVARQARTNLLNFVHQATKNYCSVDSHSVYVGQLITLETTRYRSLSEVNFDRLEIRSANTVQLSTPSGRSHFVDAFPDTEYFCMGRIYYARDLLVERNAPELDMGFYEVFLQSVGKNGLWTMVDWTSDYFLWSLDGRGLPNVTCQLWEEDAWRSRSCATIETTTDVVHCNCTKMTYLRISNETESENISIEPTMPTLGNATEPMPQNVSITTETGNQSTSVINLEDSASDPVTNRWPTTMSPLVSNATGSDMMTLSPITTSPRSPVDNVTVPAPSNTSESDNVPRALQQATNGTGSTLLRNLSPKVSTIGYTIIGAMALGGLLMVVIAVVYRRRKSVLRLADELHTVPSRARAQSSPHVRYARFQDEHNMSGDNVSTISDVLTI